MSHYTTLRTQFIDPEILAQALADLGFSRVEVHSTAQPLFGYQGDERLERAEVIIRRQYIGPASNDIGFSRTPGGIFEAVISEHDRDRYNLAWLNRLAQRYAYHLTCQRLASQGFELVGEETSADGQVHLILRRVG